MAKRQTMQWDANVHEDILICMFQHLKLNNEEWTSVMAELQKLGYTFTESALRYELAWFLCSFFYPSMFFYLAFFFALLILTLFTFTFPTNHPSSKLDLQSSLPTSLPPPQIISHSSPINHLHYHPNPAPSSSIIVMSGKPSRGWDANSHEDLLLTLLEEIKPSRAVLTSVSERMREKGYSYSFDAIKYRTLFPLSPSTLLSDTKLTCQQPARPEASQGPRHQRQQRPHCHPGCRRRLGHHHPSQEGHCHSPQAQERQDHGCRGGRRRGRKDEAQAGE